MTSVLVPIFICVVLPVSVVLIRAIMNMHTENKRSEVLLKAIEATNCSTWKGPGERASDFRRAVSGHRT